MKTKSFFIRRLVMMLVMALSAVGAMAQQTYISDIYIYYESKLEHGSYPATPSGYEKIDTDLNDWAGGQTIYLYYKTTTDIKEAITDIIISVEKSKNVRHTIKIGKKKYQPAASKYYDGNVIQDVRDVSHYIYLYYTKDTDPNDDVNNSRECNRTAVTSLDVISVNRNKYGDFRVVDGYVEKYDYETQSLTGVVADCNQDAPASSDIVSFDPNAVVIKMDKVSSHFTFHELKKQDYVAPTFYDEGRYEHYKCSECNKLYMDQNCEYEVRQSSIIIPAHGKEPTPGTVEGNQRIFNGVEFISDIYILNDVETVSGYKKIDVNLNKGTNSDKKVHLCYKTTTDIDEAITDVIVVSEPHGSTEYDYDGPSTSKTIIINGRTYYPARATYSTDGGNLNYGVSNDRYNNLYIYYTKDSKIGINNTGVCYQAPIIGLKPIVDNNSSDFNKRNYGYVKKYNAATGELTLNTADCNENAGGDWVSIWMGTAPAMIMSHEVVKHDYVAQTCTTDGQKEYYQCKHCHRNYADKICTSDYRKTGTILPALGGDHELEYVAAQEPTCYDGQKEHYQCTHCYAFYDDSEAKKHLTEEDIKIPGLGHQWKPVPIKYDAETEEYTLECARDVHHEEVRKHLCLHTNDNNALITVKHFGNSNPELKYSKNGGEWTDFPSEGVRIDKTDLLWLKGFNPKGFSTSYDDYTTIYFKNSIYATGSVMSLTDGLGDTDIIVADYCFNRLFENCELTKAPKLPATRLKDYCYFNMFAGSFVKEAPELPALIMEEGCYEGMFSKDIVLTKAPELPAMNLADKCYQSMFEGTDGLRVPPSLPATELANLCYRSMFWNSGIKEAPYLPAKALKDQCYSGMFYGCESITSLKVDAESCNSAGSILALPNYLWLQGTAKNTTGILEITDEAALDDGMFLCLDAMLPDNWKINKFGIHANMDPTPDKGGDYYSTFYSINGDFAVPEGTTAYTGHIEQKDGENVLRMKAVANGIIPSGEAVVLKGNSPEYILTLSDENVQKDDTNDLQGTATFGAIAPAGCYIFTYAQHGLGFYQYAEGKPLTVHKAYLVNNTSNVKGLRMLFDDEDMNTSIVSPVGETEEEVAIYNLQGVRMNKLQKGINIVNGKKVVIK